MSWIEEIKSYKPLNNQELKDKERLIYFIENFKDILSRQNEIAHVTSSAFIVNKDRDKVLMVYHNIYNSWSWVGGHADEEEDLLAVAIREAKEETGITKVEPIIKNIFSIEVLPVVGHMKRGKYVSAHLHLSVTFLLQAEEKETLKVKEDENSGVKWIPINEVISSSTEPHMQEVYKKLIDKINKL